MHAFALLAPLSLATAAAESFFSEVLGTGYLATFFLLVLAGLGLPLPEEITMLGAGFLAHRGDVELAPIIAVCLAGTLLGDTVPYYVGRHFGRRALRSRAVRRALHPERLRSIERRFERNWVAATFVCRFLPGLRSPAWFTAGSVGIPYHRFILVDAAAAAIMAPLYVTLGRLSGEAITEWKSEVEGLTHALGFVALALIVGIVIRVLVTHKPRRGLGGAPRRDRRTEPRLPAPTEGAATGASEAEGAPIRPRDD